MKVTLIFSSILALIFFVIALLISATVGRISFADGVAYGAMTGLMAFIASVILCSRDRRKFKVAVFEIRQCLNNRDDLSDDLFCAGWQNIEADLLLQIRQACAEFFGVPRTKICPSDDLREDLAFGSLEPAFHHFVVCRVVQLRKARLKSYTFTTRNLQTIGDLAREVKRILEFQADRVAEA